MCYKTIHLGIVTTVDIANLLKSLFCARIKYLPPSYPHIYISGATALVPREIARHQDQHQYDTTPSVTCSLLVLAFCPKTISNMAV
jgi:hypothetical protein